MILLTAVLNVRYWLYTENLKVLSHRPNQHWLLANGSIHRPKPMNWTLFNSKKLHPTTAMNWSGSLALCGWWFQSSSVRLTCFLGVLWGSRFVWNASDWRGSFTLILICFRWDTKSCLLRDFTVSLLLKSGHTCEWVSLLSVGFPWINKVWIDRILAACSLCLTRRYKSVSVFVLNSEFFGKVSLSLFKVWFRKQFFWNGK